MSKSFPTVHKLDARALMKISRLPWKDFSLSLSLSTRNIFPPSWQPRFNRPKKLWRHRLLGTSVICECVHLVALLSEQGFAQGLVADLENSGSRTSRWSLENFVNDGWSWTLRFCIKVSTSNLSLYIVASQLLISLSLFLKVSRIIDDFQFRVSNSIRIFRETGKLSCLIETILVSSARRILVIPFYLIAAWIRTLFELIKGLLWK